MKNNSQISSKIPFMFEKNIGQHNNESKFVLRSKKGVVYFLDSEIVFALMKTIEDNNTEQSIEDKLINVKNLKQIEYKVNFIKMKLENSNQTPEILGEDEFNCKINYFKGSDSSKWKTNIPIYEKIIYKAVYPGIDLTYYENEGMLEHDFIIYPNGDVDNIKMYFEGLDKIELDKDGNILMYINDEIIQLVKPRAYQEINNKQIYLESNFVIEGQYIKFNVKNYDKSKVLVIDPIISYGTYLGGITGDIFPPYDNGNAVAVDNNGYVYITGATKSGLGSELSEFPITADAYQGNFKGSEDAFLIKIDTTVTPGNSEKSLLYGTYLGGTGEDIGYGVAVDDNGYAYITGSTKSGLGSEFPITADAYQRNFKGSEDAFLIKIDTTVTPGNSEKSLLYGTYLGGNVSDVGYGVAVDNNGNVYITGSTTSTSGFPLNNAYQDTLNGVKSAFLIKLNTTTSSLLYGTYLGGNGSDIGYGIAIDNNENSYITGSTTSTSGFPVTQNAYQGTNQGATDVFLIKLDTNSSGEDSLIYGTYLGGSSGDVGNGVAVDNKETAYITGYTSSTNFPTTSTGYQPTVNQLSVFTGFLITLDTRTYDILLQKSTCECKVCIGDKIVYTIKVTNNGPDTATNIVVTDKLINGLTIDNLNSSMGTITSSANTVTWNIDTLALGQSAIAMIVVKTNKKLLCQYKKTGNFILNTATLDSQLIVNPDLATDTVMTYVDCTCNNNPSQKMVVVSGDCSCKKKNGY